MSDYLNEINKDNLERVVAELKARVAALEQRTVQVDALDQLGTDDLGDMRAGRFLALSNGSEPTDGDASGVFMSSAPIDFPEGAVNVGGVENGKLQFGISALDGSAMFGGGACRLTENGLGMTGLKKFITQDASGEAETRRGEIGMEQLDDEIEPSWILRYSDNAGVVGPVNGDFELDLAGWTETAVSGVVEWSVVDGVLTAQSTGGDALLESDPFAVDALKNYRVNFDASAVTPVSFFVSIYFYNGLTYLSGRGVNILRDNEFSAFSILVTAPASATHATIVIRLQNQGSASVDNIKVYSLGEDNFLAFEPRRGDLISRMNYGSEKPGRLIPSRRSRGTAILSVLQGFSTNPTGVIPADEYFYVLTACDETGETEFVAGGMNSKQGTINGSTVRWFRLHIYDAEVQVKKFKIYRHKGVADSSNRLTYGYIGEVLNNNSTPSRDYFNTFTFDDQVAEAAVDYTQNPPEISSYGSLPAHPMRATLFADELMFTASPVESAVSGQRYGYNYRNDPGSAPGGLFQGTVYLAAGKYYFRLLGLKAALGGIGSWYLDDKYLGTTDFYASTTTANQYWFLGPITIEEPGNHVLRMQITGKNGSAGSTAYRFYVTKIWFTPTAS